MANLNSIWQLDTPSLLLDLDILDQNLTRMEATRGDKRLRIHFKSLKCAGLAKYLVGKGYPFFLCAKLHEAEVLVQHGIKDILLANQIVGEAKLNRLMELLKKASVAVCADCAQQVEKLSEAALNHGVTVPVMVELDIGMSRCGVLPGDPALALARVIAGSPNLRFAGIQAYDGQLQLVPVTLEKEKRILEGIRQVRETCELLARAGIPAENVTGSGTGTYTYAVAEPAFREIQPGSFLLMDAAYCQVRPEFSPSLTLLVSVISNNSGRYILDAGSKAISKDFALPIIKDHPEENLMKLAEEHARVEIQGAPPAIGEKRQLISGHCCATMNLHRQVVAHRSGIIQEVWPIEASGRYD